MDVKIFGTERARGEIGRLMPMYCSHQRWENQLFFGVKIEKFLL